MYTDRNFKKSTELREAVARYLLTLASGQTNAAETFAVTYFQPGPFGGREDQNSDFMVIEGPHYPAPHTFYVKAVSREGKIVWVDGLPATLNPTAKTYNVEKGLAKLREKYPILAEAAAV